ncbi:MAG TPA: hypothetical protein VLH08_15135 [Acidobacteriota bacterium]|nr:hypothetical protein [Acidobacteriota bacterium]
MEFEEAGEVACENCKKNYGSLSSFSTEKGVAYCIICGCRDLYTQKDFSRKVGLSIVAIGAILAPFTKLISLFVCALIDLILYRVLPMITVCYRCKAIYRGFPNNTDHQGFNLGINDRYRSAEKIAK